MRQRENEKLLEREIKRSLESRGAAGCAGFRKSCRAAPPGP